MHQSQKSVDLRSAGRSNNETPSFEMFISGDLQCLSIAVVGTDKTLFKHTVSLIGKISKLKFFSHSK